MRRTSGGCGVSSANADRATAKASVTNVVHPRLIVTMTGPRLRPRPLRRRSDDRKAQGRPMSSKSSDVSARLKHVFSEMPIPTLQLPEDWNEALASVEFAVGDARSLEPLVSLQRLGISGRSFYARRDGKNPPYHRPLPGAQLQLKARRSVGARLAQAEMNLRPFGLRLHVFDAFRGLETQSALWAFHFEAFRSQNPTLSIADLEAQTHDLVHDPRGFDPTLPASWPLHATGGAVDLTLATLAGRPLDLGTPFDDPSRAAESAFFEEKLAEGAINVRDSRLVARRILYWTLREAGFANYPNEWWHYDYGDQMYVYTRRLLGEPDPQRAWYGPIASSGPRDCGQATSRASFKTRAVCAKI
jgi:D-alanyl-D-alanine dipeptidase